MQVARSGARLLRAHRPCFPCLRHPAFSASTAVSAAAASSDRGAGERRLCVVDTLPWIYTSLHSAQAAEDKAARQGLPPPPPSRAAEDFVKLLLVLIEKLEITHMAVVVDTPGANWRELKWPRYKAHRPESPPTVKSEVAAALALVDAAGIQVLAVPGVEADDVIGSLTVRAADDGFDEVTILSKDHDFYQLLRSNVHVIEPARSWDDFAWYGLQQFQSDHKLRDPSLWTDVKALAGDASDNIPGVHRVGQVIAERLVQQLGDVESILARLAQDTLLDKELKLNAPQAAALRSAEGAAAARLAKQLVTIVTDLKAPPLRRPWEDFELRLPDDGGALAVQRAVNLRLHWLGGRLKEHFERRARAAAAAVQA